MGRIRRGMGYGVIVMLGLVPLVDAATNELPKQTVLPLALAAKAAAGALDTCTRDGYRVSAAVVNRDGVLIALMRADGAGPHTVSSSTKKAYTAASLRRPTSDLADLVAKQPALQSLRDMDSNILILGGGLPIEIGGEVIGGIGVGGAPGSQFDEACARAGLENIGAAPKAAERK